ncbi:MAG: TIGR03915 family putative DNA repair protein [Burkholderiales bacterium]|nr:TIGR03915 family putative DNA repair protein [Burkholderiales bacterium]
MEARLASPTDIVGFRSEARNLLAHKIPPEDVTWTAPPDMDCLLSSTLAAQQVRPPPAARAATAIVPASFVRLCEYVVKHRDADRFSLLYRLLWRLVHEPHLRHDATDGDMTRAQHMAHAVRRDIHKVKMHLRFREVHDPERPGSPVLMAWCEPAHHVLEAVAPWFTKRCSGTRWALMTPQGSIYSDGHRVRYALASGGPPLSAAMPDADWLERWHQLIANGHATA